MSHTAYHILALTVIITKHWHLHMKQFTW